MSNNPRCEFVWNPGKWPYAKRCEKISSFVCEVTDVDTGGTLLKNFCEVHSFHDSVEKVITNV